MSTYLGKGFALTIGGTTIGQIVSWSGPDMSFGTVETTDLSSTIRTFTATIQDSGTAEFTVNWDPDTAGSINHPTINTTFRAGAAVTLTGTLAGVTTNNVITSTTGAILTSFRVLGFTVDSILQVSVGVKFSGDVTFA